MRWIMISKINGMEMNELDYGTMKRIDVVW